MYLTLGPWPCCLRAVHSVRLEITKHMGGVRSHKSGCLKGVHWGSIVSDMMHKEGWQDGRGQRIQVYQRLILALIDDQKARKTERVRLTLEIWHYQTQTITGPWDPETPPNVSVGIADMGEM